jgi:hypothetical protein
VRCCWRSARGSVCGRGSGSFRFGSGWVQDDRFRDGYSALARGRSLRAGGSVGRFVWDESRQGDCSADSWRDDCSVVAVPAD